MENKETYNEALYDSGFHQKLEYLALRKVNKTEPENTMNKSNIFFNINYGKGEINNNNKYIRKNNYRNKNR